MVGVKGKSGAPRKPAALRRAEGNRSKRPIRNEPQAFGTPIPPDQMGADERALWEAVIDLSPPGMIAAIDGALLEIFVGAWATYRKAKQEIDRLGLMIRGADGSPIRNPYIAIAKNAAAEINTFGGGLGLSPAARARLVSPEREQDDPLALLMAEWSGEDGLRRQ